MTSLLYFTFLVLHYLLQAVIWVVIANAILSWLIAFQVINMRNQAIFQIVNFLDAVTRPMLRPFRRIIPTLGGVDITPVILIILVTAVDKALLPALYHWLVGLVG